MSETPAQYARRRSDDLKAAGKCIQCATSSAKYGSVRCEECLEYTRNLRSANATRELLEKRGERS